MRGFLAAMLVSGLLLGGCGGMSTGDSGPREKVNLAAGVQNDKANAFNPYLRTSLPNLRTNDSESQAMLQKMGGKETSIEGEAAYRPQWKQEIYPVFFGDPKAPHEVLVLLDFASPQSEKVWQAVAEASRSVSPQQCKVAVCANSKEYYGTDLMGMGIWISHSRPGQAMQYMTYALSRWNEVKAAQKKAKGRVVAFNNEYDATVESSDFPIHYSYMSKLRPPVNPAEELVVGKYCYNAGNVNLYQAQQIAQYFGIKTLPAVIVDGNVLSSVSASSILKAME